MGPATRWLKTHEAAAQVGLSVDTIRDAIKAGKLRAYRPGGGTRGHLLVSPYDLEAWVCKSPAVVSDAKDAYFPSRVELHSSSATGDA